MSETSPEYAAGKAEALRDFDQGGVTYTLIGMPAANPQELQQLAKERYNINLIIGGCMPVPLTERQRGYKETVLAEWRKRYPVLPLALLTKELIDKHHGRSEDKP